MGEMTQIMECLFYKTKPRTPVQLPALQLGNARLFHEIYEPRGPGEYLFRIGREARHQKANTKIRLPHAAAAAGTRSPASSWLDTAHAPTTPR